MRLLIFIALLLFSTILNGQVHFQFSLDKNYRGINDVLVASDHTKYVALDSGAVKYINNGVQEYYHTGNGLPSNKVNCIAEDDEGGIWFGTSNGLTRLKDGTWTTYTTQNSPIRSNKINAIHYEKDMILIGTDRGISILYYRTNYWYHYYSGNRAIINDTILTISYHNNKIYAGTPTGLFVSGSSWQHFNSTNSGLGSDHIFHIKKGGDLLYFNTADGIYFLRGNEIKKVEHDLGPFLIFPDTIPSITTDPDGNLYFVCWYDFEVIGYPHQYIMKYDPNNGAEIFNVNVNIDPKRNLYFLAYEPVLNTIHIINHNLLPSNSNSFASKIWVYFLPERNNSADIISQRNLKYLDINKIKAGFYNNGTFNFLGGDLNLYKVPYDTNNIYEDPFTVFSGDIWVAGRSGASSIKKASSSYGDISNDYLPGPIDPKAPGSIIADYNKIWKVNRDDIEKYRSYFYGGGDTAYFNYVIPEAFLTWPANHPDGSVLAPFYDANNDGIYDPYSGDHPEIKGDQMLWWVFNDGKHREGGSMMMEFHVSAYAFHCPAAEDSMDVIERTTFYEIKMVNKGKGHFYDMYSAIVTDVDIGYAFDDYIGSNPEHNYGFFYNGDNNDLQFGEMPPMMNYVILKGPKADENDGIDNNRNGVVDEPDENNMMSVFRPRLKDWSVCTYPYDHTAEQYHRYMRGLLINGDSLRRNGYGCSSGDVPTTFVYDGVPYADTGWTEINKVNPKGERSALLSSGPFSLLTGESKTLEYAIVYTRDTSGPNGLHTSIKTNHEEVVKVINWHNTRDYTGCTPSYPVDLFKLQQYDELVLYPNPAKDKITIRFTAKEEGAIYTIFDMQGRVRMKGKMNRYPFHDIDISRFETGTFVIRVVDADAVFIRKFVKAP